MTTHQRLVLASASPRRSELLERCGCPFEVRPADIDEQARAGEAPADYVRRMAGEKARAVQQLMPDRFVLGADTAVVLGAEILGKPQSDRQARTMLKQLSACVHQVYSAVALACPDGRCLDRLSVTEVDFAELPADWIERYVRSGDCRDKAGAYGIQNQAGLWVRHLSGSYSGVVGLPLYETSELLREAALIDS